MAKITLTDLVDTQNKTTFTNAINANNALIETAIENTLSRDGTSPNTLEDTLDVNSQQIINLPTPATANSPLRLQDLSDFTSSGTVSNIPVGGTTGQALIKTSGVNYAVGWGSTLNSISSPNSTLSVSTVAGAATADINLAHANTWPGQQTFVAPALGTPASGVLTNATGLPIATGVSGLAANVATFLASPSSANLISVLTDETGTGANVFATSPTLVTPVLGTPSSGTLTSCTGLPVSTGISGLAAGVATFLATPSSANLATAVTNETGSGALVFGTSPAITTPTGIVKGDVGLGNVDNTSDATKNSANVTLTTKTFNTASNTFTVNGVSLDTAWTSYTPTVTSGSGTFTTVSATGAYKQIGKTIIFKARVSITTNGTAAGRVEATIPVAVGGGTDAQALCGQNNSSAAVISAAITPGVSTTKALMFTAAGAYPGADATVLIIGGSYEVP